MRGHHGSKFLALTPIGCQRQKETLMESLMIIRQQMIYYTPGKTDQYALGKVAHYTFGKIVYHLYISLALLSAFVISIPLDLVSGGEFDFIKYILALAVLVPCLYGWRKFLRWLHPRFETVTWRVEYREEVLLIIVLLFVVTAVFYGTGISTSDILFNYLLKIFAVYSGAVIFFWFKLTPRRLVILTTTPVEESNKIRVDAPIEAKFSKPVRTSSIKADTVNIVKSDNEVPVEMTVKFRRNRKVLTLKPNTNLDSNCKYEVTLHSGITALFGAKMVKDKRWSFTTMSNE